MSQRARQRDIRERGERLRTMFRATGIIMNEVEERDLLISAMRACHDDLERAVETAEAVVRGDPHQMEKLFQDHPDLKDHIDYDPASSRPYRFKR